MTKVSGSEAWVSFFVRAAALPQEPIKAYSKSCGLVLIELNGMQGVCWRTPMKVGDLVRCTWQPKVAGVDQKTQACLPMKHTIEGEVGLSLIHI